MSHAKQPLNVHDCVICGKTGCTLKTHKTATFQFFRRVEKANWKKSIEQQTSRFIHARHRSHDGPCLIKQPSAVESSIDPFTTFPVPGATKDMIRQFHDFFTTQGAFVTEYRRRLVFDRKGFAGLYPASMRNPALCMSVIAMATSYNDVHFRDRVTPDKETLLVYGKTFKMIRAQIDEAQTPEQIESTIGAVLRLAMSSGVGFGDADATITHWNGVLALLDKYPYLKSSGRVAGYVTSMEYWIAIKPGVKPRSQDWPVPFVHQNPPPEMYGQDLPQLFNLPEMESKLSSKLLSISSTTCRATEVLEIELATATKRAKNSPVSTASSPYFMHLSDVLMRQHAQLHTVLTGQENMMECVSITLNLYFMVVIRCTPWRAPFEHLCTRLRDRLTVYDMKLDLRGLKSAANMKGSSASGKNTVLQKNLYLWMLIICACALQLCRNRPCHDWVMKSLRTICHDELSLVDAYGQAEVLRRLRRICWSDIFLFERFKDLCEQFDEGNGIAP